MIKDEKVYKVLAELDITYTVHEHPAVITVEEAEKYWDEIDGLHCKNLFLRDEKGTGNIEDREDQDF